MSLPRAARRAARSSPARRSVAGVVADLHREAAARLRDRPGDGAVADESEPRAVDVAAEVSSKPHPSHRPSRSILSVSPSCRVAQMISPKAASAVVSTSASPAVRTAIPRARGRLVVDRISAGAGHGDHPQRGHPPIAPPSTGMVGGHKQPRRLRVRAGLAREELVPGEGVQAPLEPRRRDQDRAMASGWAGGATRRRADAGRGRGR